ncbi:Protein-lysine N-methyltransferase rrg1 [Lecanora helva]
MSFNPTNLTSAIPLHGPFLPSHIPSELTKLTSPSSPTVLDLPHLHTHPSASTLLSTLSHLTLPAISFTQPSLHAERINENGIPAYLTRIISSSLSWIRDENEKEAIYEAASARLAERAGRGARVGGTRVIRIPIPQGFRAAEVDNGDALKEKNLVITLHEPSLTGDNLGHKTWVASYLLAKRLPQLLSPILDEQNKNSYQTPDSTTTSSSATHPRILELGSGTGLVGLTAALLFPRASIHLTDLPSILPNLEHNIQLNSHLLNNTQTHTPSTCPTTQSPSHETQHQITSTPHRPITSAALDWSHPHPPIPSQSRYTTILAADSLYMPPHAAWLAKTIDSFLSTLPSSRVVVELPIREGISEVEHQDWKREMRGRGFGIVEEGWEEGFEEWEDVRMAEEGEDRRVVVRCWWSVWKRISIAR